MELIIITTLIIGLINLVFTLTTNPTAEGFIFTVIPSFIPLFGLIFSFIGIISNIDELENL